jgi:hypothetical protein
MGDFFQESLIAFLNLGVVWVVLVSIGIDLYL